ncbi:DUF5063 domain-containing protein [Haloferula sp.]|uniref:DUF5063 domain-containing protein n=1 Tax=Haloferula sp. TaxID=2497595 RepID=UPI00329C8CFA
MSLAAENFTETVERFCEWVEQDSHTLLEARQFLISLMGAIPHLQDFRFVTETEDDYPSRGHEKWKSDLKRFADLPFQYYRVVFDPHDMDSADEPVTGDLHDDLADIYGDLWTGLQAQKADKSVDALSIWIDSYFYHWGHHASCALNAIDEFYRQNYYQSEQAEDGDASQRPC